MEIWAQRIKQLLDEGRSRGLTQTGLARACGRSQPSLSQWFNDSESKPSTQMIMGDNLVAAARYLGTTPEWIMTGETSRATSQPVRLAVSTIAETAKILRKILERRGERLDMERDADLFSEVYALLDKLPSNPSQEATVDFTATVIDLVARRLERSNGRDSGRSDRGPSREQAGRKAGAA